jgi:hypothetical protein
MIYISGDTHGEIDHKNISSEKVKKACGEFPEYVIILGDFGFIWKNDPFNETEMWWLNWVNSKPWTTLFIDGNHENHFRLNNYPTVNMFGSTVGQITDNIFHLKRGNVYNIDGKTIFCMGGAESTDKENRKAYIDWWPEEVPSYKDYYNAEYNLQDVGFSVDYVLTHTAPQSILQEFYKGSDRYKDSTALMLEELRRRISYVKWFHGHMHEDIEYKGNSMIGVYHKGHII